MILFICFLVHSDHAFNSDEGVILSGAWNLYNGKLLYTDFFEFIPPGSFYLILFIWKIFSVSFLSAKIISILLLFLSAIGVYFIAQKIYRNKLNIIAPIFFCLATSGLPIINHNFYSLPFALWALYFLLSGLDNNEIKNYIVSGLLTGMTILFLQTKGLAVGAAIFLFLLIRKRGLKNILSYITASIIPLLVLLFWPPKIIIDSLILFPSSNYYDVNKIPITLLLLSVLIFVLVVYLFRREKDPKIWLLFMVQFFLLLTTIPLPDYYHLIIAATPIMALPGIIISKIQSKKGSIYSKFAYYYLITIIISLVLYPAIDLMMFNFRPFWSNYNRGVFLFIENNCPGKYIYAGPFWPSVYFESRKLNATPYSWLITNHNTPEQFLEAQKYLAKNKPTCAVLVYPQSLKRFNHNQDNPVENFIRSNYHKILSEKNIFIYKAN